MLVVFHTFECTSGDEQNVTDLTVYLAFMFCSYVPGLAQECQPRGRLVVVVFLVITLLSSSSLTLVFCRHLFIDIILLLLSHYHLVVSSSSSSSCVLRSFRRRRRRHCSCRVGSWSRWVFRRRGCCASSSSSSPSCRCRGRRSLGVVPIN